MNNQEYAKLIEIPVSPCEVTVKQSKKTKQDVKEKVIKKINSEGLPNEEQPSSNEKGGKIKGFFKRKQQKPNAPKVATITKSEEKPENSKFDVISFQVVTIFVLIVGIILTNVFWEDSGINTLLKNVFSSEETTISATYDTFDAGLPSKTGEVTVTSGIMQVNGGSIYTPCNGFVENVQNIDGKYTLTIRHSDSFTTVVSGLEFYYAGINDTVYDSSPIGYSSETVNVSMFSSGNLLTAYALEKDGITWMT